MKKISMYYLYGCEKLLTDLREVIDTAAVYEEEGKTPAQWLDDNGLENVKQRSKITEKRIGLSWGAAINIFLIVNAHQLTRPEDNNFNDMPF